MNEFEKAVINELSMFDLLGVTVCNSSVTLTFLNRKYRKVL